MALKMFVLTGTLLVLVLFVALIVVAWAVLASRKTADDRAVARHTLRADFLEDRGRLS
jgi:hypothetical protein